LRQAFDIVVVNDPVSLGYRPLEPRSQAFADFGDEVLPARVTVLARDHQLRVALRQWQLDVRQVRARTRYCIGIASGNLAGELLCLLAEGLEGRTRRE
jgi:hypothetical protein